MTRRKSFPRAPHDFDDFRDIFFPRDASEADKAICPFFPVSRFRRLARHRWVDNLRGNVVKLFIGLGGVGGVGEGAKGECRRRWKGSLLQCRLK